MTQKQGHAGSSASHPHHTPARTLTQGRTRASLTGAAAQVQNTAGAKGWRARQKHWGELKDLFNGCQRRFWSGGWIDNINKLEEGVEEEEEGDEEEEVRFYWVIMQQQQQKDESSSPLRTRSKLWWVGFLFPQWSSHPSHPQLKQLIWFPDCGSSWLPPRLDGQHICPMN